MMRIMLIDDEAIALEELKYVLEQVRPQAEVFAFNNCKDALELFQNTKIDVAMLDVQMPEMDGLTLAARLKEFQPEINVIFVTAYSEFALPATELFCSGYLMKPYRAEAVVKQLDNLRFPVKEEKLRVCCFGNFDVYCGENPIHFKRQKAKELLAYLVDRQGASATAGELCAILFEGSRDEERNKSTLRIVWHELRTTLKEYDAEEILLHKKNAYAINKSAIKCDYYDYLDKVPGAQYLGKYMEQYSWAEITAAGLDHQVQE